MFQQVKTIRDDYLTLAINYNEAVQTELKKINEMLSINYVNHDKPAAR